MSAPERWQVAIDRGMDSLRSPRTAGLANVYSHCRYNSIAEKKLRLFTSREYSLDDWMSLAVLALAARPDKEWLMSYCVQRNSHEKKIMRPPLYTILLL